MNTLPPYFVIRRDASSPLWQKYIDWLNEKYEQEIGHKLNGHIGFYGFDGRLQCWHNLSSFQNNPVELTLSEWDAIINPTMKPNLVPFTISAWNAGAKPFTRDGREVKQLICFEGIDNQYCLCGVLDKQHESWTVDGEYSSGGEDSDDLMLEAPVVERFAPLYKNGEIGASYPTLEAAQTTTNLDIIVYIKVTISGTDFKAETFKNK